MKEPPRRPWAPPKIKGDPLLDAALHRRRFWAYRSTATDWWKIRPDYGDALFALCGRLAVNTYLKTWDSPVNPHAVERRVEFLDGGVEKYGGGFFIGRQGTWVFGRNALRLIL